MAKSKKLLIQGESISINDDNYVSLTDIAKRGDSKPDVLITSWLKKRSTLLFLNEWETLHNENFNVEEMNTFRLATADNLFRPTPKSFVEKTGAISIISKKGRYGGTFAHTDIALNFCYWLSPAFQVYLLKEFQRLKEEEFALNTLQWHISKITDYVDNARILLDSIPHQHPSRIRISHSEEE